MRHCDLHSGAARIRKSLEDLQVVWQDAADQWRDAVSAKFQEQHLDPLIPEVKLALDAVGRMQQLLTDVQRDCEE